MGCVITFKEIKVLKAGLTNTFGCDFACYIFGSVVVIVCAVIQGLFLFLTCWYCFHFFFIDNVLWTRCGCEWSSGGCLLLHGTWFKLLISEVHVVQCSLNLYVSWMFLTLISLFLVLVSTSHFVILIYKPVRCIYIIIYRIGIDHFYLPLLIWHIYFDIVVCMDK